MENASDALRDTENILKRSKITQIGIDFSSLSLQTQVAAEGDGCGYKKINMKEPCGTGTIFYLDW